MRSPRGVFGGVLVALALAGAAFAGQVSPPGMKAYEVSLAVAGPLRAIAWHGHDAGPDRIQFEWLDAKGDPKGAAATLTDGSRYAFEPDLVLLDGAPYVAWYEKAKGSGELTAWLARLDAQGKVVWRRQLDGAGGQARNPVLRVVAGGLDVAWIETPKPAAGPPRLWMRRLSPDGRPAAPPREVGEASATTWNLNAATDDAGDFLVVYDATRGAKANELQLVAVAPDGGVRRRSMSADDGFASVYPDLAISPTGQAAITWFDARDGNQEVYLAVMPLTRLLAGDPLPEARITHTPAPSIGAYLAWNGKVLGLAWCDAQEGRNQLYGQTFDARGKPVTDVRRLAVTATDSYIPSIRADGSGFLIGWNEYGPSKGLGHAEDPPSMAMTLRWPGR